MKAFDLIVVTNPVYCATDRSLPRWKFIVEAVSRSPKIQELTKLAIKVQGINSVSELSLSGDELSPIVLEGDLTVVPKGSVAVNVSDFGKVLSPKKVNLHLDFTTRRDQVFHIGKTIELARYPTVWLDFPLRGRWVAANARQDHHCLGHQFGFDFVTPKDMRIHLSRSRRKYQMHEFSSFGEPIFSPAAGMVASCSSKNHDFLPMPEKKSYHGRTRNLKKIIANHVLIKIKKDQYLLLAHMRKDSICVRCRENVRKGQKLGGIGNSGNTSGPHLHIELIEKMPLSAGRPNCHI